MDGTAPPSVTIDGGKISLTVGLTCCGRTACTVTAAIWLPAPRAVLGVGVAADVPEAVLAPTRILEVLCR